MRNISLLSRLALTGFCATLLLRPSVVAADSPVLHELFPEMVNLLYAHDVLHARAFEEIEATNASAASAIGQRLLTEQLEELATASASHYHSAGDHLAMLGPHRVFESRAVPGIIVTINRQQTAVQAEAALAESGTLPPIAVATLKRGREFVEELIEIYLDAAYDDKKQAVDAAVQRYLSDDEHSVAAKPKSDVLLADHPYAYAYRVGFPQFSGLTWASQWLKIATLEVLVTAGDQETKIRDVSNVLQFYKEKTTRLHGSLVSLPSDIPTIPVIAPNFYTVHPEASAIVDNLEALKVVIGDVLAYPNLMDRPAVIESMVASYTNKTENLFDQHDYLISVLRGGIYNAGGPARGGMDKPDRNYSRERQENPHIGKFSMSQ
jgi:hypothetical protein